MDVNDKSTVVVAVLSSHEVYCVVVLQSAETTVCQFLPVDLPIGAVVTMTTMLISWTLTATARSITVL